MLFPDLQRWRTVFRRITPSWQSRQIKVNGTTRMQHAAPVGGCVPLGALALQVRLRRFTGSSPVRPGKGKKWFASRGPLWAALPTLRAAVAKPTADTPRGERGRARRFWRSCAAHAVGHCVIDGVAGRAPSPVEVRRTGSRVCCQRGAPAALSSPQGRARRPCSTNMCDDAR